MRFIVRAVLISAFFVSIAGVLPAQDLSKIQNVKVDDLSDSQIQQIVDRARSEGLSENDIYNLARSRSVPESEIQKLQERITTLRQPKPEESVRAPIEEKELPKPKSNEPTKSNGKYYYGYEFFGNQSENLTFETDLFTPVPEEYVLGPRDEITINIYGSSEKLYKSVVSETGYLNIANIGPVYVAGYTMDEASLRVKARLASLFRDLSGDDPTSFMNFTLSRIRNIKVNIVGEIERPGTYTVNALATVFNALYASGGPTKNGTLREIKVIRENQVISLIDYYAFLTGGVSSTNITLQTGDLILVGPHVGRVEIQGAVKKPGYYEIIPEETFQDLLKYSGGFADNAYMEQIKVERNTNKQKIVSDLYKGQFELFNMKAGDVYNVGKVLNRYDNRVVLAGAVYRPGSYALEPGMTVKDLIKKGEGLLGNAFTGRALLVRTKDDLSSETLNINIKQLLAEGSNDVQLKSEDVLTILTIDDLKDERYVRISGAVNKGGVYPYSEGMTVQDLILTSEGFSRAADPNKIEIARKSANPSENGTHEVIEISLQGGLESISQEEIKLNPYDHVFIRRDPNFFGERTVEVAGEVKYPGKYALVSEHERISDVINRTGGLQRTAYTGGATLIRKTEYYDADGEATSRKADLKELVKLLDTAYLNNATENRIAEIYDELNNKYLFPQEDEISLASNAKRERLINIARQNPFLEGLNIKRVESIAIDLDKVFKNPGGMEDLLLKDGDIISIPKELNTIRLRGRVLYPNTVRFEDNRNLKYYISQAGGFGARARKGKTYVVYPNGEVARTRRFLFYRSFPKAKPGSEVIVPTKPLKIPLKPGELVGISGGLGTLGLVVVQIIQLSRNN